MEAGVFTVMDRGYVDFERLYAMHQAGAFFVTRAKQDMDARRVYSHAADRTRGVICDQTIRFNGFYPAKHYPEHLRRIRFKDPESGKTLVFLTNNTTLPASTIAALYKSRWQVELRLEASLCTLLQILSVSVFEKTPRYEPGRAKRGRVVCGRRRVRAGGRRPPARTPETPSSPCGRALGVRFPRTPLDRRAAAASRSGAQGPSLRRDQGREGDGDVPSRILRAGAQSILCALQPDATRTIAPSHDNQMMLFDF